MTDLLRYRPTAKIQYPVAPVDPTERHKITRALTPQEELALARRYRGERYPHQRPNAATVELIVVRDIPRK